MIVLSALSWLLVGALLTNAIPHFVQGISGNRFPTPFAKPRGRGLSPPWLNLLWAYVNLTLGAIFLFFNRETFTALSVVFLLVGSVAMSVRLTLVFSHKHQE